MITDRMQDLKNYQSEDGNVYGVQMRKVLIAEADCAAEMCLCGAAVTYERRGKWSRENDEVSVLQSLRVAFQGPKAWANRKRTQKLWISI